MESASLPGTNNGVQIVTNSGSLSANIYQGETNITIIRSLARSIHRSFSTSIDPFKLVQNELAFLLAALDIADSHSSPNIDEIHSSMKTELLGCQGALIKLREMKIDYDSGELNAPNSGSIEDDSIEHLTEIRHKLSSFTNMLSLVNTNAIRVSQEHVERMLKRFLDDDSSRERAKSIMSRRSTFRSSMDEDRENWRLVRVELQAAGISSESFSENLDLIISMFKKSGFTDDLPPLGSITEFSIRDSNTEPPLARVNSHSTSDTSASQQSTVQSIQERLWSLWPSQITRFNPVVPGITGKEDLVKSAQKGNIFGVIASLEAGQNINSSNGAGDSALSLAAAKGHKEIVLLLLSKGANVEKMNKNRETVVVQAARNGQVGIFGILEPYADLIDEVQFRMALGVAAENGHEDIVKLLLDRGVDADYIDSNDETDNTPLFKAAEKGHKGVVRILLDHGVPFKTLNFWNESALFAACRANQRTIARLLVKYGASLRYDSKASDVALSALSRLYSDLSNEERMRDHAERARKANTLEARGYISTMDI